MATEYHKAVMGALCGHTHTYRTILCPSHGSTSV